MRLNSSYAVSYGTKGAWRWRSEGAHSLRSVSIRRGRERRRTVAAARGGAIAQDQLAAVQRTIFSAVASPSPSPPAFVVKKGRSVPRTLRECPTVVPR